MFLTSLICATVLTTTAPETWFHIIGGNASKEGMAADLDAIAEAGISGIQFFHGHRDGSIWPGVTNPVACLSEPWVDLVAFTERECHRRGLTFKMQNCPGWSMSGGPWIRPEQAMRKLVAFEPGKKPAFDADDDYREIGTLTFPVAAGEDEDAVARSVILPAPSRFNHNWAYVPRLTFRLFEGARLVAEWACPQGTWADTYRPDARDMTFDLTRFGSLRKDALRLEAVPGRAQTLKPYVPRFSSARRLDNWEAKAGLSVRGFAMSTNATPVAAVGTKTLVFGHVNAKRKNGPAPAEATGWECDKLDPRGFEANWEGYLGKLVKAGVKIDGTLVDSWECGSQSWTWKMEEEFAKRAGYPLRPWLPALFGYVLGSERETERFLLDWRNVCSRLIEENYFGTIARITREHGMTLQFETAFGDVITGDLLRSWKLADEPMFEFWSPHDDDGTRGFVGDHDFKASLPCVSAAHLYGKRRVSAESLTGLNVTFDENFGDWKKIIDRHFGRGLTHVVFHTYTHNPVVGGKPPSTSFGGSIGSPFLRGQTWWPYLKEFTAYLAFCGRELERGLPVIDILMYLGDDVNHKPMEKDLLFDNRYKYDYLNNDVLTTRLAVKDGRFVLPDGMSYRVLWIPKGTFLLPETERRLAELARQGARIVRGDFTPDWPSPLKALVGLDGKDVHWYQRRENGEDIFFVARPDGVSLFAYCRDGRCRTVDPVRRVETAEIPLSAAGATVPLTPVSERAYRTWDTKRTYERTFAASSAAERHVLSLGKVRDWATVWVNGKEVSRLWCAPYACDISKWVKAGENRIRVEVTTTWYNTLVHEAALPESARTTWTKCGPKADAPFHEAGLLGPVSLTRGVGVPAK